MTQSDEFQQFSTTCTPCLQGRHEHCSATSAVVPRPCPCLCSSTDNRAADFGRTEATDG